MPKQPIKLSSRQSGRRVRWTFEVSADVDAEKRTRVKKPAKKRRRAKPAARQASPSSRSKLPQPNDSATSATPATAVASTARVIVEQPAVESASTSVAVPVTHATPSWQPTRGQMATLAGVAVLVIATVAMPQRPPASVPVPSQQASQPREFSADAAPGLLPTATAPAPRAAAAAARPVVETRPLTEPPVKPSMRNVTNRTAQPSRSALPAALTATDNASAANESPAKPAAPEPVAVPSPASAGSAPPAVTVTGCLEISVDGNEFRLADTEGTDAPKARSWRTGFLKKRTAPVALVGTLDLAALKNSVGKRVTATGVLTSRELQVSSLRVVRSSCN